jgi:hypothetical protein
MSHLRRPGKNSSSNGRLRFITGLDAYPGLITISSAITEISAAFASNPKVTIALTNEYAIDDIINHIDHTFDHLSLTVHNQTIIVGFSYNNSYLRCHITYSDIEAGIMYSQEEAVDILNDIIDTIKPISLFEKLKLAIRR